MRSLAERFRVVGLVVSLLGGAGFFAWFTHGFYPLHTWLFFRYAGYVLLSLIWLGGCAAAGDRAAGLLWPQLARQERLTLGLALGVLGFALAVFFLGLLHALHWITFVALPVACYAIGRHRVLAAYEHVRRQLASGFSIPIWHLPLWLAGVIGISLLYVQAMIPEAFSFDSRWYHLPLAQRYALAGAVSRFEEGFWMAAYPQLASYLYTWCFLLPGVTLFDRVATCAHVEAVLFVATLAQIPVLVRRLAQRTDVGPVWLVLLAFPGIYLYDSNLHAGADHVAAFFAIPIALSLGITLRSYTPRNAAGAALCLAGAALTKYTAVIAVVPAALSLVLGGIALGVTRKQPRAPLALLVFIGVALLATAPHWLKNVVYYGDPLYPILNKYLPGRPFNPDVQAQIDALSKVARPGSLTSDGLLEAFKAMFTFSFVPNDWHIFHRDVPIFGSLFTLTLPCLFFLHRPRWLWAAYLGPMAGVFVWFILSHYDRFLQALVPWMAAATGATLVRVWHSGAFARLALVPLVGLQVAWGSDVPFIRTHNLINDSPTRKAAEFFASGYEKKPGRLQPFAPLPAAGRKIPEDGVVLAHDVIMILGIDRQWVTDLHQSRISYGRLVSPSAIHRELRALGVTHLIWPPWSLQYDSLAGDLAFLNYAYNYTTEAAVDGIYVAPLPERPPANEKPDYEVALYGCGATYRNGTYRLSQLTVQPGATKVKAPKPLLPERPLADSVKTADFVVVDPSCRRGSTPGEPFFLASRRGNLHLYVKRVPE
jgi:hypothetical protein